MGNNNKNNGKGMMRDALTGGIIAPNKEVILVENAIEWAKKQGYLVIRPRQYEIPSMMCIFSLTFLLMISLGVII